MSVEANLGLEVEFHLVGRQRLRGVASRVLDRANGVADDRFGAVGAVGLFASHNVWSVG